MKQLAIVVLAVLAMTTMAFGADKIIIPVTEVDLGSITHAELRIDGVDDNVFEVDLYYGSMVDDEFVSYSQHSRKLDCRYSGDDYAAIKAAFKTSDEAGATWVANNIPTGEGDN